MSEFKGKAGTIYIEKVKASDREYEVWLEDFCILGTGNTELEALQNAGQQAVNILEIIVRAMPEVATTEATHAASGGS